MQEVLLRFLEKAPSFESTEHERAWLLRVTNNCCMDCLRFRRKHAYTDLDLLRECLPAPEQQAHLEELYTLPVKWKSVLILHYFEGYSVAEIAKILRLSESVAVLIAAFAILISGITSFAYNIYQEKNLAVFMESGLSQAEIERIGGQLSQIPGVSSCRFVSGDEAWNEFSNKYLDAELSATFTDNPLKNSFNYRLGVRLDADTEKVREDIAQLAGVRLVQNLEELKE